MERYVEQLPAVEQYQPTEPIRELFKLDQNLIEMIKETLFIKKDEYSIIENYCKAIENRIYIKETELAKTETPDIIEQKQLVAERTNNDNNGNNFVYSILMNSQLEAGGLPELVERGDDLVIGWRSLQYKRQTDPYIMPSYQLWAGLYLDLREELFGPEQRPANIELIEQLREQIAA